MNSTSSPDHKVSLPKVSEEAELTDWAETALYKEALEDTSKPHDPAVPFEESLYSQIECEYLANTLKRKLHRKDTIDEEKLEEVYEKGLRTL